MQQDTWQGRMQDHLSDAHAAAQNRDYDEAAMWAHAALKDWKLRDRGRPGPTGRGAR
jgi:hypothetical protein